MSPAIDWTRRRQPCPACNKGPRDTALSVTRRDDGSCRAFCFRCGYIATDRTERAGAPIAAPKAPTYVERLSAQWEAFWQACKPLAGTVAETYLQTRCCVVPPSDGDLRFHGAAWHWPTRTKRPALVARLTDVFTGEARSLHFTYLKPDGSGKTDADPARLLLPGHRKAGAVCRLWPDEALTLGLAVGEGVETSLTLAHAFRPVWAAIDAGNLAALPVLEGVEAITVGVDHDPAGITAAHACAERWRAAGREARLVLSETRGFDLNDEVCHARVA